MIETEHDRRAEALARWSLTQALWPVSAVATTIVVTGFIARHSAPEGVWIAAYLLACAAAITVLGFSMLLLFDALLFRLIASYEDEQKGGAAVDDLLVRMRLKPIPSSTRPLAQRAAGTRRLVGRQRVALILFAAALAAPLLHAPN